jgi:hypothetical protein
MVERHDGNDQLSSRRCKQEKKHDQQAESKEVNTCQPP